MLLFPLIVEGGGIFLTGSMGTAESKQSSDVDGV
jgi:hypothetical protein